MSNGHSIILTTTDSKDEADRLASGLVGQGLAACVQITTINSHFVWEGKQENAEEFLLLIKTRSAVYEAISEYLGEHHSYDTPELLELPVSRGSAAYLAWVDASTGGL